MTVRRFFAAMLLLAALASAVAGPPKNITAGDGPPEKLSDLYKFLTLAMRKGLAPDLVIWPIRLTGRAAEIIDNGMFYEIEMSSKPFELQGLSFEKGEFFIKKMSVDQQAMQNWELKLLDFREVQTRLIFTLRSLEKKLIDAGYDLKLRADSSERVVELKGRGRFCLIPMDYDARCSLRWDEKGRKLYFEPKSMRWAGFALPRLLWWLGSHAVPKEAILDLSYSWIPLNIQEIYVGWDRINLSTNW